MSPDFCPRSQQKERGQGAALVELVGVTAGYDGQVVLGAAGPVDVEVRPGEIVVVSGRSGAGKSTLLRVALGLQRPTEGTATLDGEPLAGLSRAGLAQVRARCSAVVLQQVHLAAQADPTANLDLSRAARGLPADPDAGAALLAAFDLSALAGRRVGSLSGGERQRVAVARALATRAPLLVLDEPTSQVDEAAAETVAAVLRAAAEAGVGILLASHDPVLLAGADRIVALD